MAEDEYAQALNALGQGMREISTVVNNQGKEIEHLRKPKEDELPWYLARTPKAMQDQLEKMGWFTKEQAGLQDDFDNTFRLFTQVSEKGDLVPGLTGAHGPASLMELYQTMDLRGLIWNYGLGWISALKGGYNVGTESGKDEAKKFIEKLRETRMERDLRPVSEKAKEFLEYTQSLGALEKEYRRESDDPRKSDELAFYNKTRKNEFNTKVNGMKFLEKDAYLKLLKIKNDIKEFKAQKFKPIEKIQRYWV